jgi:hypothetical protein
MAGPLGLLALEKELSVGRANFSSKISLSYEVPIEVDHQ